MNSPPNSMFLIQDSCSEMSPNSPAAGAWPPPPAGAGVVPPPPHAASTRPSPPNPPRRRASRLLSRETVAERGEPGRTVELLTTDGSGTGSPPGSPGYADPANLGTGRYAE